MGSGHNGSVDCGVAPFGGNGTGSTVGNPNPPFAERTIIHGGKQSMPLAYDNTMGKGYSEAVRTFDAAQDWTPGRGQDSGAVLPGASDNGAGQVYVKINGVRVDYTGNAAAITMAVVEAVERGPGVGERICRRSRRWRWGYRAQARVSCTLTTSGCIGWHLRWW